MKTTIVIGVMTNLVLFFTIEYIHPQKIITNYSHICCVECAGFFVAVVKTSCCQFVMSGSIDRFISLRAVDIRDAQSLRRLPELQTPLQVWD
jgi:hypothetical protein